jgi:putative membrane protein
MRRSLVTLGILLAATIPAAAHGPPRPLHEGPWWTAWNLDQPLVVSNLGILSAIYAIGLIRIWRKAGLGKSIPTRNAGFFAAGMLTLWLALLSPIDVFADELS